MDDLMEAIKNCKSKGVGMKYLGVAFALSVFPGVASAQSSDWVLVAHTHSHTFEARKESLERTKNKEGVPVVALTFRSRTKASNQIQFERNYVEVADCTRGQGNLWGVNMNGDMLGSTGFIFGGGNASSIVAEAICKAAFPSLQQQDQPSRIDPVKAYGPRYDNPVDGR